jgi:CheY-like chemotaxis protein
MNAAVRTVLVVDDAQDCVSTLDMALAVLPGVTVCGVPSAEDALVILESRRVSGVITDIQLPVMTGLELIARIRGRPEHRTMPIVVISAVTDPSAPETALRLGADAYFSKPFSPGAVRKKMEELFDAKAQLAP